jgi:hypothetical protein
MVSGNPNVENTTDIGMINAETPRTLSPQV